MSGSLSDILEAVKAGSGTSNEAFTEGLANIVKAVNKKKSPSNKFPDLPKGPMDLKRVDKASFKLRLSMWQNDPYFENLNWDDATSGTQEQQRKIASDVMSHVHNSYHHLF